MIEKRKNKKQCTVTEVKVNGFVLYMFGKLKKKRKGKISKNASFRKEEEV